MGFYLLIIFVSMATLLEAQLPLSEQEFFIAFSRTTNVQQIYTNWTPTNAPHACQLFTSVIKCTKNSITFLKISDDRLTGVIPSEIGLLTNLDYLDFSYTQLNGSIPQSIGSLSNLVILSFEDTKITGSLPDSLNQLHKLQRLFFPPNIRSTIPENIGDLSMLLSLIIDDSFYGTIPSSIGNLERFTLLRISSKNILGTIPSSMNQLSNLNYLGLQNNLVGTIPGGFSGLTELDSLVINEPTLKGNLYISAFHQLELLDLEYTSLNLCGCFAVTELRWCSNITSSNIFCSCHLPSPCMTDHCTTSPPCGMA